MGEASALEYRSNKATNEGEIPEVETMDLDAATFGPEVLACEQPVLVDFWSQTCPHCLRLAPHFADASAQYEGQVKFVKVAAQAARPLFTEYGVSAVPTLVLFADGKEVTRRAGEATADEIIAWIEKNVG